MREVREDDVHLHTRLTRSGRYLTATVLIAGPLVWCVGLFLRWRAVSSAGFDPGDVARFAAEPFAVREQLAAYAGNPSLTIAGYAVFLTGAVLLIPATAALAHMAAPRAHWPANVGGVLMTLGLVARVYFTGVEQTAFQLVDAQGVDAAAETILNSYVDLSYGPWRVPVIAAFGQYAGALLLAVALYRAKVFGGVRTLVLLWWATMWTGVLKTTGWSDIAAGFALFIVLALLAVRVLGTGGPRLRSDRGPLSW
jgi:hypothetical protein